MKRAAPVLVVDDERHARRNVLRFLREDARFAAVGEATDGIEALEMIDRLAPAAERDARQRAAGALSAAS